MSNFLVWFVPTVLVIVSAGLFCAALIVDGVRRERANRRIALANLRRSVNYTGRNAVLDQWVR